jgi:hypothetical protein
MTDFFTRLAERTLGVALVVQPLIASRFAPGSALAGDGPLNLAQEAEAGGDEAGARAALPHEASDAGSLPGRRVEPSLGESESAAPPDALLTPRRDVPATGLPTGHHGESNLERPGGIPPPSVQLTPRRESPGAEPPQSHHAEPGTGRAEATAPVPLGAAPGAGSLPVHRSEPDAGPAGNAPPVLVPTTRRETVLAGLPRGDGIGTSAEGQEDALPVRRRAMPDWLAEPEGGQQPQDAPLGATLATLRSPALSAKAPHSRRTTLKPIMPVRAEVPAEDASTEHLPAALEPLAKVETRPGPPRQVLPGMPRDAPKPRRAAESLRPEQRQAPGERPGSASPQVVRPGVTARQESARPVQDKQEAALPMVMPNNLSRPTIAPRELRPRSARVNPRSGPGGQPRVARDPDRAELDLPSLFSKEMPTQAVVCPNVVPFQEPARSLPEPPPSPPTVRVTIGRVEVRAVQPPPPPPSAAPVQQGPALSLDEYLKQRNEGQR